MLRDGRICSIEYINGLLDHGLLLGLDDDDHSQYLLASGARDLTGNWTIATNSITLTAGTLTSKGLTVDTDTLFVDSVNHRVGMGTVTPGAKLHVSGGNILVDNNQYYGIKDSVGTVRNVVYVSGSNKQYIGSGQLADLILQTGGNVGIMVTPTYKFSVGSADNSDQVGIYHDNADAYFTWTDGVLNLITDEATDTDTFVNVKGKGTGFGNLQIYDQDDAEYLQLRTFSGLGLINVRGVAPQALDLQDRADVPVRVFSSAADGETQEFRVHGFPTGIANKFGRFKITDVGGANHFQISTEDAIPISIPRILKIGDGGTTNYTAISATGSITQYGSATADLLDTDVTGDLVVTGSVTASEYLGGSDVHLREDGITFGVDDIGRIYIGETPQGDDALVFEVQDIDWAIHITSPFTVISAPGGGEVDILADQLILADSSGSDSYIEAAIEGMDIGPIVNTNDASWPIKFRDNTDQGYVLWMDGYTGEIEMSGIITLDGENAVYSSPGIQVLGKLKFTQTDGNEFIDSLNDGYMDYGATTAHRFNNEIIVTGSISSATLTTSTVGPTDNLDVTAVNTVFMDCSGGDVTIGGFAGGVNGQVLRVVKLCASAHNAILEHAEAEADQAIFLHKGADETLNGEYGGWTLVCNGTNWYDLSHAKHID